MVRMRIKILEEELANPLYIEDRILCCLCQYFAFLCRDLVFVKSTKYKSFSAFADPYTCMMKSFPCRLPPRIILMKVPLL